MTAKYEDWVNAHRSSQDDGKRHHKFSCRESNTQLTIPNCVRVMLGFMGCDIHAELVYSNRFDPTNIPSESSFCQVRDKIPLDFFSDLFYQFVNQYYWLPTSDFSGFRMFAVDGTEGTYPANPDEPANFVHTRSAERARNLVHISSCYDVDRYFTVDLIAQDAHAKDERSALYQFIQRIAQRFPNPDIRIQNIMTTDRGYEAWNLPVLADCCGISFLCRVRADDSNAILSGLREYLPTSRNSYDRVITITLTRDSSKKNLMNYHYIGPSVVCELVRPGQDYTVTIRIVKVRVSDSVTEFLITNLTKNQVSKTGLMHLYHRRWGVETSYNMVKYPCCLTMPHAASKIPYLKEMYCRFILYNVTSAIVYHDSQVIEKKEDTGRKYDYTRNFSSSIADVRSFLLSDAVYDLDPVVRKQIRPIRDTKSTERHKTPRKPPKAGHRLG